jgi:hypothetical protein
VHRDDLIKIMREYLKLNPAEFKAEMWALTQKPVCKQTTAEKMILKKPIMATQLREALIHLEGAKAYVRFTTETKTIKIKDLDNIDKIMAVRINPDDSRDGMDFVAAVMCLMDEKTFVLVGDSDLGKTALARCMCATYCEANGTGYFIESNTPDSLRTVCVNGFFRPFVPVLLDEWKPQGDKYTGKDGIDMLKCLCTVGDGSTIKCRYSDIRFCENMPRIMTCNCKSLAEWCEGLGEVTPEDLHAILKRCVFIELSACVIPDDMKKDFIKERRANCFDRMEVVIKGQGVKTPIAAEAVFKPLSKGPLGAWTTCPV